MTGKLDARMRAVAQNLVDTYGKPLSLRERTGEAYDPETGMNAPTYTDHAVNGALSNYADRHVDGTLVKTGDLRVIVPAKELAFVPSTEDKLTLDGDDWSVINAARIYSGEEVAAYRLQIRR